MRRIAACVLAALALAAPASASAQSTPGWGPPGTFAQKLQMQDVAPVMPAQASEPPLDAVPRAKCGPGSAPETGIQGRVPPDATNGFHCNMTLLGQEGAAGGFKVQRYVDRAGHECAFYDTTLLFPSNAQNLSHDPTGVAVLDMSNPAKPVRTTTLVTPAMQTPHESVLLNERRGLLAAVMGNPAFYPGFIDLYDVSEDCLHPALQSSLPVGLLGHESGFAPDGNTFYATSLSTGNVTAVDVSNPKAPVPLWEGQYNSHGLTISDDGNRAYVADYTGLIILDVSEVQARKPNPQVHEVSRLTWDSLTIPQVAQPVTIDGRHYLVEIDEYATDKGSKFPVANGERVGAARIIDIENEKAPRVVSNIRLAVHQPENRAALAGDPGASSSLQGYAGHYCTVPRRTDPGIVACSMIASGLRVFDIREPKKPKEIAYFTTPLTRSATAGAPSNYAMSGPAFAPERGEIWYSDGNTGFYALRVAKGVWPFSAKRSRCTDRRAPRTKFRRRGLHAATVSIALRGRSRDRRPCRTGVRRVQVSLARVRGGTSGVNCRFLTSATRFRLTKPTSCRDPVLFTAKGKRHWSFRFRAKLAPGAYRAQARATDRAGNREKPGRRSIVSFRVR
ncbi:MAG: hypothetical protein QOG63_2652 [Thermoleophilaceae bacterium]|nr:hypothetical protein [Thermoleophilaceae bacterium]